MTKITYAPKQWPVSIAQHFFLCTCENVDKGQKAVCCRFSRCFKGCGLFEFEQASDVGQLFAAFTLIMLNKSEVKCNRLNVVSPPNCTPK